jgi:hypothetical protein
MAGKFLCSCKKLYLRIKIKVFLTGETYFREISGGQTYSRDVSEDTYARAQAAVYKKMTDNLGCYNVSTNSCVTNVRDVLSIAHTIPMTFRPLPSNLATFITSVLGYSTKNE